MPRIERAHRFIAAKYRSDDKIKGARTFNRLLQDGKLSKGVIGLSSRPDLAVPKRISEYDEAFDPGRLTLPDGQQLVHFSILSSRQDMITTEEEAVLFRPSITVKPSKNLFPQALGLFRELCEAGLNINNMRFRAFIKSLRIALRNEQISTGFRNRIAITPDMIADILSGEIFTLSDNPYSPIFQREQVADMGGARRWMELYLLAATGKISFDQFAADTMPRYFIIGATSTDIANLRVTPNKSAFRNAVFPDFGLKKGEFYYVHLFYDNLVGIQFRVLDRNENVVKKYAFDASVPGYFSSYEYGEEERRQFEIFNQHLLSEDERAVQAQGILTLKALCCALMELPSGATEFRTQESQQINFKIPGPARRLTLQLPDGKTTTLAMLNLEPQKIYSVNIVKLKLPGSETEVPAIVFFQADGTGKHQRIFYWSGHHNAFVQIFTRKMDEKGRTTTPEPLIPRPWDNEHDQGLVL